MVAKRIGLALAVLALLGLSGCVPLIVAGAASGAAAGGYVAFQTNQAAQTTNSPPPAPNQNGAH